MKKSNSYIYIMYLVGAVLVLLPLFAAWYYKDTTNESRRFGAEAVKIYNEQLRGKRFYFDTANNEQFFANNGVSASDRQSFANTVLYFDTGNKEIFLTKKLVESSVPGAVILVAVGSANDDTTTIGGPETIVRGALPYRYNGESYDVYTITTTYQSDIDGVIVDNEYIYDPAKDTLVQFLNIGKVPGKTTDYVVWRRLK